MGAPTEFTTSYDLPPHIQREMTQQGKAVMVVNDHHPLLVAFDFAYPYLKGPVIGFVLLAFWFGAKPAWQATVARFKPK